MRLVGGPEGSIVAIATPPGRGALALVRLSGQNAFDIAGKHVRPWPTAPREAQLTKVFNGTDEILDQALVTLFPRPNSFTGEDTVEFSTHGGYSVPASIVAALISSGARQAQPGEFTRRAILNGKIDVLQAEAIGDLINARSRVMQGAAIRQLDGGLSRRLLALREELIALEALIAYDVDFPDEDDGPVPRERIEDATARVLTSVRNLLATASTGELIRDGVVVVIAGPPNAGKSSLFNALLGSSRAIVTEIPGTTRDALEAVLDGGRWPLRLVDTAGLRTTSDRLERLGIEVSERYLAEAQVVLVCAETPKTLDAATTAVSIRSDATIIPVRTKSDLVSTSNEFIGFEPGTVSVSAETGVGLRELLQEIDRVLTGRHGEIVVDAPMLTRARHRFALDAACRELEHFQEAWRTAKVPATVAAVHLRTAVHYLEELIGTVDVEDVFDRLFSDFCVGK